MSTDQFTALPEGWLPRNGEWIRYACEGRNVIRLRVILGGNGLFSVIWEIDYSEPKVLIGKRNGVREVLHDSDFLGQRQSLHEAIDYLEQWFAARSA